MLLAQVHAAEERGGALGRHTEAGGAGGRGSPADRAVGRGSWEEEGDGDEKHLRGLAVFAPGSINTVFKNVHSFTAVAVIPKTVAVFVGRVIECKHRV